MSKYKVKVIETFEKVVEIEARDKIEARQIAVVAWSNGECSLGENNFARVNFTVEPLVKSRETYER
jgi:hypothetical protein